MNKKELTNELQRDHDRIVNYIASAQIWIEFLSDIVKGRDDLVAHLRASGDKTAQEMCDKAKAAIEKALHHHTHFAELSKGMLRSLDDETEVNKVGLFE